MQKKENDSEKISKAEIRELKVRYWYEGVRLHLGAKSAYELENIFDPPKIKSIGILQEQLKKWPRYKKGKVAPCSALVVKVEAVVPGSREDINSLLWEILLLENMTINRSVQYIDRLESSVRVCMRRWYCGEINGGKRKGCITKAKSLVRIGTIDALAALILMWEVYQRKARTNDMQVLVDPIYKCMLAVGGEFKERGLVAYFFSVLSKKVFERTSWDDKKMICDTEQFSYHLELLDCIVSNVSSIDKNSCIKKYKIMYGYVGLDCGFAFRAPVFANWSMGPPRKEQYDAEVMESIQWSWGHLHLESGTVGIVPFDYLWKVLYKEMRV